MKLARQIKMDNPRRAEMLSFIFTYTFDFNSQDPQEQEQNPYRFINRTLISEKTLAIHSVCPLVYGIIKTLRSLPRIRCETLFRGINVIVKWEKEDIIVVPAFTSMTKDEERAKHFFTFDGGRESGVTIFASIHISTRMKC